MPDSVPICAFHSVNLTFELDNRHQMSIFKPRYSIIWIKKKHIKSSNQDKQVNISKLFMFAVWKKTRLLTSQRFTSKPCWLLTFEQKSFIQLVTQLLFLSSKFVANRLLKNFSLVHFTTGSVFPMASARPPVDFTRIWSVGWSGTKHATMRSGWNSTSLNKLLARARLISAMIA